MPKPGWTNLTIKQKVKEEMEKYLDIHKAELSRKRINSLADFIEDLWRQFKENKQITFEHRLTHFNIYGDHITVNDDELARLVDVYNRNGQLICEYHQSKRCYHVDFAYNLPEVQKFIKQGKIKPQAPT